MGKPVWRIHVDTGGTFTDCLAVDPEGVLHRAKVLSSSALRSTVREIISPSALRIDAPWDLAEGFFAGASFRILDGSGWQARVTGWRPATRVLEVDDTMPLLEPGSRCELRAPVAAPQLAAHMLTQTPLAGTLPTLCLRLATTRGTNALLERRGAPVALFITSGFADLLEIGTQQRPDLFALAVTKPQPLYEAVVEVPERLAADGSVIRPLDVDGLRDQIAALVARGIRCAAVALMHSYRNPSHEHQLAEELHRAGMVHVSCSAELAPLIKLLPRASTAVVDAYLAPMIGDYLAAVVAAVPAGSVHVMTSAGGLVRSSRYRACDSLLSGPAGGVVGAASVARRSRLDSVIAFDMGGTSTDVARWAGDYEYLFEHRVGDAHLVAPALAIESVAAGGGSVCHFDGARLRVGPQSAGADPGPACYGAGGPLAVTDVNLLLGRIMPERFEIPLDVAAAELRLDELLAEVRSALDEPLSAEAALGGLLQIANERMANAIRRISVRRGHDPRRSGLVAFGGAGPQHACAVARLLGISTVVVPPDASLLSADGLGQAVVERFAQRQVLQRLEDCSVRLAALFAELAQQARQAVADEGIDPAQVRVRRQMAHLRLAGQESVLEVEWQEGLDLAAAFAERYLGIYGYRPPQRPVEVESLRVVASTGSPEVGAAEPVTEGSAAAIGGARRVFCGGAWQTAPVFRRDHLEAGSWLRGPALVVEQHSVTVVEAGWRLEVDGNGALVMRWCEGAGCDG